MQQTFRSPSKPISDVLLVELGTNCNAQVIAENSCLMVPLVGVQDNFRENGESESENGCLAKHRAHCIILLTYFAGLHDHFERSACQ